MEKHYPLFKNSYPCIPVSKSSMRKPLLTAITVEVRLLTKIISLIFTLFLVQSANAQLTGTINVPGSYATLAAAITALNTQGVGAGGVTINLLAGNPQTASAGGYVIG